MSRRVQKKNIKKEVFILCYEDETPYTTGTKVHAYRTEGMAQMKLNGIISKMDYENDAAQRKGEPTVELPVLKIVPWVPASARLVFMGDV